MVINRYGSVLYGFISKGGGKDGKGGARHIQCGVLSTEIGKKGREITGPQKAAAALKQLIQEVRVNKPEINEGKIKITHQFEDPVTIHDPCNTIRGRGLADKLRDVVHFLCANVVEMTPNREHNFCCSAGGGIINCGPPFKSVRMEGNRVKADQLRNTGVHTVVAPCHNCHGGLEDIIKHYKLGMHTKFIGDLIYELMEKPEV